MKKLALLLLASAVAFVGMENAANGAPLPRLADLRFSVEFPGGDLPSIVVTATGATVSVDYAAGTLSIAAGAVAQTAPITIPVTSTTAFASLQLTGLQNLTGVFSIGGAGRNIPATEFPCPPTGTGIACVQQTGFGGPMGLSGTLGVVVVPGLVTIPLNLQQMRLGQGGNGVPATGFTFDAAPWTNNTGAVAGLWTYTYTYHTPGSRTFSFSSMYTGTTTIMGTGSAFGPQSGRMSLVSPTYVEALGNKLPVFSSLGIHWLTQTVAPVTSIEVSKTASFDGRYVSGQISITNTGENLAVISAIADFLEVHFPRIGQSIPPPLPEGSTPKWYKAADVAIENPGLIPVGETASIDYSFDLCDAADFAGANTMRNVVAVTLANKPEKARKDTVVTRSDSFKPETPECPPPCAHDPCVVGEPLDPTCDPCVAAICAVDPYCCDFGWDAICVDEVSTICGDTCPSP